MYKSGTSDAAERPMLTMFFGAWHGNKYRHKRLATLCRNVETIPHRESHRCNSCTSGVYPATAEDVALHRR